METHLIQGVAIANGIEIELAVIASQITSETIEHFGKRRVDIEVVLSAQVLSGERSEMYFVKTVQGKGSISIPERQHMRKIIEGAHTTWSG